MAIRELKDSTEAYEAFLQRKLSRFRKKTMGQLVAKWGVISSAAKSPEEKAGARLSFPARIERDILAYQSFHWFWQFWIDLFTDIGRKIEWYQRYRALETAVDNAMKDPSDIIQVTPAVVEEQKGMVVRKVPDECEWAIHLSKCFFFLAFNSMAGDGTNPATARLYAELGLSARLSQLDRVVTTRVGAECYLQGFLGVFFDLSEQKGEKSVTPAERIAVYKEKFQEIYAQGIRHLRVIGLGEYGREHLRVDSPFPTVSPSLADMLFILYTLGVVLQRLEQGRYREHSMQDVRGVDDNRMTPLELVHRSGIVHRNQVAQITQEVAALRRAKALQVKQQDTDQSLQGGENPNPIPRWAEELFLMHQEYTGVQPITGVDDPYPAEVERRKRQAAEAAEQAAKERAAYEEKARAKYEKTVERPVSLREMQEMLPRIHQALGVLGLPQHIFQVDDKDVRDAHRKLAKLYHPDMNRDKSSADQKVAETNFRAVQEAYDYLESVYNPPRPSEVVQHREPQPDHEPESEHAATAPPSYAAA